jgi:molybdopterin converting factor small subunit
MDSNAILQKTLNTIDEIKESLNSEKYLEISNDLNSLYKSMDNNFYKVTYLTTKYSKNGKNSYLSLMKKREDIIIMTNEEFEKLDNKIKEGDGYARSCCDMTLQGIKDRLSCTKYHELVGHFEPNSIHDSDEVFEISDLSFELTLVPSVAFLGVTKL